MSKVQILTVGDADEGARLDKWFKRHFPHISHGKVEKLLRTGQIRIDGKRAKGRTRLETGQKIRIPPLPEPGRVKQKNHISNQDRDFIRSLIIFENDELYALNKPSGLAVQGGSKTHRHIDGLLFALGSECRLVHRLDRDTSGVLLIAKNAKSARWIGKIFQNRKARKIYWGITNGVPQPRDGEIKGYIAKSASAGGREIMQAVRHGAAGAKHAHTIYKTISCAGKRAGFVIMQPLTGRKHQLRLHMQLLGAPLAHDSKYLTDRPPPGGLLPQLHLHAKTLVLPLAGGDLYLDAPLPKHIKHAFDLLGFDENINIDNLEF